MYGIYLIGILVVTGGAIAFIGDKLGTKIGKKRLSIFNLRPRHTSMIITVITGSLITALTMGTLAVISKDVRTALFGMEELNATIESTKIELEKVTDELFLTQEEHKKAEENLATSEEEIATLKTEQEELTAESERLKSGNEQLEREKSELTAENQNLTTTNSELLANNKELETNNKKLAEFNVTLTSENEKLTKDKATLEEHTKNLREGLIAMREGDIIFKAGEILSAGVINANQSSENIAEEINKLADAASRNISERFGETVDSSVWIYQPELNNAIETISKSKQDMILRITAAGNLVRGEPIRTSLALYPNKSVYEKGEFIFSKVYEINSANEAQNIVQDFLLEVNRSAVNKGVLADPISGTVGIIDGEHLYKIINTVSSVRGKVYLTAYAGEKTSSMGPLRLNIKIGQKSNA